MSREAAAQQKRASAIYLPAGTIQHHQLLAMNDLHAARLRLTETMPKLICGLSVVAVVVLGTAQPARAELPTGSDPLLQCHKVQPGSVGLIVRAAAAANGRRVGSLAAGSVVQLDGEKLEGTGAVYPQIQRDKDGAYWIKIKTPTAGFVLFTSEDDPNYRYLVPCK